MSNEVTLFRDSKTVFTPRELDETTKALIGNVAVNKRISIRGCVFRMIVNGKEIATSDNRVMDLSLIHI